MTKAIFKIRNFALILSLFQVLNLIGCAYGSGEDEQAKDEIEQREKTLAKFEPIIGTYRGEIRTTGKVVPVLFWVYSLSVVPEKKPQSGSNLSAAAQGDLKDEPKLFLRLRETKSVRRDSMLSARFTSEINELFATTTGPGLNLRLILQGEELNGEVSSTEGKYGDLTSRRISREYYAPEDGGELDYLKRAKAIYEPYVGTYNGTVTPPVGSKPPYPVEIRIRYSEIDGPRLTALYRMTNYTTPIQFDLKTSVNFDETPARLTMLIVPQGTFSILGTITPEEILGEVESTSGYVGKLKANKTGPAL